MNGLGRPAGPEAILLPSPPNTFCLPPEMKIRQGTMASKSRHHEGLEAKCETWRRKAESRERSSRRSNFGISDHEKSRVHLFRDRRKHWTQTLTSTIFLRFENPEFTSLGQTQCLVTNDSVSRRVSQLRYVKPADDPWAALLSRHVAGRKSRNVFSSIFNPKDPGKHCKPFEKLTRDISAAV